MNDTGRAPDVALIESVETVHAEVMAFECRTLGRPFRDDSTLMWADTGVPAAVFNGVIRTRLLPDEADDLIRDAVAGFRERGSPFQWWITPGSLPDDLDARLTKHGLVLTDSSPAMIVDAETMPPQDRPTAALVKRIDDPGDLEGYLVVLLDAFDMPRSLLAPILEIDLKAGVHEASAFQRFIAAVDGRPAGASAVFAGSEIALVCAVATLDNARRQGVGGALTRAAVEWARDRGLRHTALTASEMGYPVYRRLGFIELCKYRHFCLPDEGGVR